MSPDKTLAAAALIGLLSAGATTVSAYAADNSMQAQATDQKPMEKHACKGQNSCKGNGGGDRPLGQELVQGQRLLRDRRQQTATKH